MPHSYSFSLLFILLVLFNPIQAQPLKEAKQAFQKGSFEQAISHWQTVLATTQNTHSRLEAWFGIARAYQWLGLYKQAEHTLTTALPVAQQKGDDIYHALLLNELSKVRLSQGGDEEFEAALQYIETALEIAQKTTHPIILAEILKHQGHLLTVDYDYQGALEVYRDAMKTISKHRPPVSRKAALSSPFSKAEIEALPGKILISMAQTTWLLDKDNAQHAHDQQAFKSSMKALKQALEATEHWQQATYSRTLALINLSQVAQKIQAHLSKALTPLTRMSYQALQAAQKMAKQLNNPTAKAYSYGYLGQLYAQVKRYDEALSLSRQAVFFAQQTQTRSVLYFWQWQQGRILSALGNKNAAINLYRQAIKNLSAIRRQVASTGYLNITKTFREKIAPLYFELADLLLQQARETQRFSSRQALLRQARKTVERFKEAELQDYFQNECIDLQSECTDWKQILDDETAILYPISLADRLVLLLERRDGLVQASVPIAEEKLHEQVISFLSPLHSHPNPEELARSRSQRARAGEEANEEVCTPGLRGSEAQKVKASAQSFMKPAQTLYNWLIKPFTGQLDDIKTLVIVPDGVLRMMPFGALHDGQHFLIEKMALATLPTLCLSIPPLLPTGPKKILLSGLSKSVQGFSALPCTQYELETLETLYDDAPQLLLNEKFTIPKLETHIKQADYPIVHIASHGQFHGDLENTFILTYNDKLRMDRLEELITLTQIGNKEPVELLTLSACETAMGDDRAALGLAGVALKAGAKTAFASLWKVDDEATPAVVIEFYRQLKKPGISKAVALQHAQKLMLTDKHYVRYQHPYYWSAFLLIGYWF